MYVYGRLGTQLILIGVGTSVYPSHRMAIDAAGEGFTDVFLSNINHKYAQVRQRN